MLIGGLSSPASEVRCSSVAITLTARYLDSPIETGFKYEWHCRGAAKGPDVVSSVDANHNILWLQRLMTVPFGVKHYRLKYRLFSFTHRMISAVQGEDSVYPVKHVSSRDGFLKS